MLGRNVLFNYDNKEIRLERVIRTQEMKKIWGVLLLEPIIICVLQKVLNDWVLVGCVGFLCFLIACVCLFVRYVNLTNELDDEIIWQKNHKKYEIR